MEQTFVKLYNPAKIENFVLPKRIKAELSKGIDDNYIFYGSPGIGKSSLSKALITKHPYLRINASIDGRIDALRNQITQFCVESPLTFDDKIDASIKVVWFEEIDKSSESFQDGLRGFMDEFDSTVRFVGTCNYIEKVSEALKSRFVCVNFNCISSEEEVEVKNGYKTRLSKIIEKKLEATIEPEAMDYLVDTNFPDFRHSLQALQSLYKLQIKKISLNDIKTKAYEFTPLYELILNGGQPEDIHRILMADYSNSCFEVLKGLDELFIKYLLENKPGMAKMIPFITVKSAEYMYRANFNIDMSTNMRACVWDLILISDKIRKGGA